MTTQREEALLSQLDAAREREKELRDALAAAIEAAHTNGRVLSKGVLHPTEDWQDCPSMLCEDTRSHLIPTPPGGE